MYIYIHVYSTYKHVWLYDYIHLAILTSFIVHTYVYKHFYIVYGDVHIFIYDYMSIYIYICIF